MEDTNGGRNSTFTFKLLIMTAIWIIAGILVLLASLFGWCAVALGAKADEETERIFNERKKNEDQ